MHTRSIFLTGFPGFIGTRIVKKLIETNDNVKINALVLKSVQSKAREIVKQHNLEGKVELLVGDVSKPNLNLNPEVYTKIANETTEIFHLAAIYDLEVPKKLAWNVNVIGTHNMLKLGLKCPNLFVFVFLLSH